MSQEFWDKKWNGANPTWKLDVADFEKKLRPSRKMLLELSGDIKGKDVLEIGCGNGMLSVYLAKIGGNITAVDNSNISINNTREIAKYNQVEHLIKTHELNAMEIGKLEKSFDLVVGEYVLHHIEPFSVFAKILFKVIKKGGRGIFFENNSRNPILMFGRNFLAGKYGIPKYSDSEEHPFEPKEIEILKQNFTEVNIYYPEFMFFLLFNSHIFKSEGKIRHILINLDRWMYRNLPSFRKYSYCQIVEFKK